MSKFMKKGDGFHEFYFDDIFRSLSGVLHMDSVKRVTLGACLSCLSQDFKVEENILSPFVQGSFYVVKCHEYVCQNCGMSIMDTEQMNGLIKKINELKKGEK